MRGNSKSCYLRKKSCSVWKTGFDVQSGTQTLISDKQPVEFSIRASGVHLDQSISGKTVNHSDGSLSFGTQACPTIIWIKEVKDGNRLEIMYADGAVETYDRFTGVVDPAPFNPR